MIEQQKQKSKHIPVLLNETLELLQLKPWMNVIDCTVGGGGHAAEILEKIAPTGQLLGLDLDEVALEMARRNLDRFHSRVMLVRANYRNIDQVLLSTSFGSFQAVLLDLGFSSMEIDDPARGFSFQFDGPLDMRFDRHQELTAAAIVNQSSLEELVRIFIEFGEEREARKIALAIIAERRQERIVSTARLAEVIKQAVSAWRRRGRIHPATQVFQALRIVVNDELGNVNEGLPKLFERLDVGGRIAVITFHSLEDRLVKRFFKELVQQGKAQGVTRKPLTPNENEIKQNRRARSAKLRVIEKL